MCGANIVGHTNGRSTNTKPPASKRQRHGNHNQKAVNDAICAARAPDKTIAGNVISVGHQYRTMFNHGAGPPNGRRANKPAANATAAASPMMFLLTNKPAGEIACGSPLKPMT